MTSAGSAAAACCLALFTLFRCASTVPLLFKEGDACADAAGTCRRLRHCAPAVLAVQQGLPAPRRCGFVGHEEVVCCPADDSDVAGRDGDGDVKDLASTGKGSSGDGGRNDIAADDGDRPSTAACDNYKNLWNGLDDYILGGKMAAAQEFPHMAALGYNVPDTEGISWLCGGTLISDQFVLTAAHCCSNRVSGRPVSVRLGTLNPSSETAGHSEFGISEIVLHPGYRKRQFYSDIALLRLDRKVPFRDTVFPACLETRTADTSQLVAAGWGATNAAGTRASSVLMKTTITPFPLSDCQSAYKERFPRGLNSSVICAGDPQGKSDTCVGDSGGPLVTGKNAPYTVVGITSLGPKPCGGTVPSIYTRVSSYLGWVEEHVWS